MIRKVLLGCGIASSLLNIAMNIAGSLLYYGYDTFSQEVSELSAIGAPTRAWWVPLAVLCSVLTIAFGMGVLLSTGRSRALKTVGAVLMAYGIFSMWWPPMHQREVIAAGGSTLTDTLHLVWAGITVFTMFLYIVFGAIALGGRFRWYSIGTAVILLAFGILTGPAAAGISTGQPTPWAGVIERITIFMDLQWIAVLATVLLRSNESENAASNQRIPARGAVQHKAPPRELAHI